MKTGIYKFKTAIIDGSGAVDGKVDNPLFWKDGHWERPGAPCKPVDLSKGKEMTVEEVFLARIYKAHSVPIVDEPEKQEQKPSAVAESRSEFIS